MRYLTILFLLFLNSCTTNYYVVRHAEKSTYPKENPELTEEGAARAERLRVFLLEKKIKVVYSTNTTRTINTAKPIADQKRLSIYVYEAKNQDKFIEKLKKLKKNTLIVGHSNTLKPIVNKLAEKELLKKDLEDNEYNKLFVIKRKAFGKPKSEVIEY
ncbi:MAG: histidine phosphatase family protein [Cytophagaceae bacterium]|nr:histidine phosphatase family protein [Cytophagaceae bacterium]MBL0325599.1 histidine phosphatase family protein [Cytophagaceae bacterium]